jgi:hypothetical protein
MTTDTLWLEFKALRDQPGYTPCPFCGIKHERALTHPYCTEASSFVMWCDAKRYGARLAPDASRITGRKVD